MKIKLENLTKKFGDVVAVNDLTVTFETGKLISLLGPSGCGKSTILYMLAGIVPVTSGNIYFDDDLVTNLSPEKRGVGLVFQNYALYPHMTVLQNICFPLEIQKVSKPERIERAKNIANLVHIYELMNRKPSELSGGQQQRVAIARALVKKPNLLLLDEPLSNLDARLRIEMREEIRRIQIETGVTTIFVTHDQEEAMSISDNVLLIKAGENQQYAKPQLLYDSPANFFVAEFLGTPPINRLYGVIKDGRFLLKDGSASCELPYHAKISEGTEVILAIRPESILVVQEKSEEIFEAEVIQIYRMGKEVLTHIRFGSSEIRAYISTDIGIKVNDRISIKLKGKGVFLFNTKTGEVY